MIFFDFDKTITRRDTLLPLAYYICKKSGTTLRYWVFLVFFVCFKLRFISNWRLKQLFLSFFFDGQKIENLKDLIRNFEEDFLFGDLNPSIHSNLRKYIDCHYKVFIVSANFDIILANLSILGGAEIIATRVSYNRNENRYRIEGNILRGIEKLRVIERRFGECVFEEAKFYGDREDKLLLKAFTDSFTV
ncbi:MAG: haloacid dehalogenase-like hydrolase [Candidatus Kariarchaeaceae archaeon]|jgi:phosphoserine phosphatase